MHINTSIITYWYNYLHIYTYLLHIYTLTYTLYTYIQQIFEVIVAPFTHLLPLRDLYTSDDEYLTFFNTTVSKALTSLLTCMIHKDILWKPINHSILMTCRDSRCVVRLMAVSMLQCMFTEVSNFICICVYIIYTYCMHCVWYIICVRTYSYTMSYTLVHYNMYLHLYTLPIYILINIPYTYIHNVHTPHSWVKITSPSCRSAYPLYPSYLKITMMT